MATSYSTNLALALPATGELSGTWGTTVNANITNMLDQALGYQAFSATGGSDTLTIPDGTTGVARSIYIQLNGTGGGTVNVPTTKTKMYFVFNNTASAITFKVTGQTGVSIPAAAKIALVSNGTDIITAENYLAALTLGAALPVASGGTGLTAAGTVGNVLTSNGTTWQSTAPAVTLTGTETLTNKTLTAPTIASANLTTALTLAGAAGTNGQVLTSAGSGLPSWITPSALTLGTPVATTSGTSITFTGIPAGVKQINIMFNGVSIDSTNDSAIIQLGDSGGIEISGYGGAYNRPPSSISTQFTNGFIVFDSVNTAFTYNGLLILTLQNSSTNTFTGMSTLGMSNAAQSGYGGGVKSLSAVLTQIRLTTINGASSFDAGEINISYL